MDQNQGLYQHRGRNEFSCIIYIIFEFVAGLHGFKYKDLG